MPVVNTNMFHTKTYIDYTVSNTPTKRQDKVLKALKDRLRDYHEKHTDCLEKNQELLNHTMRLLELTMDFTRWVSLLKSLG